MRCVRRLPPLGGGLGWGYITPLHHRHFFAMGDIKTILRSVRRFGETKQVYRIQDVGLSLSVKSYKAVEFGRKLQTRLANVAVV